MKIASNKRFTAIVQGDTASIDRTLHVGDMRAWAAAFGESNGFSASDKASWLPTSSWSR
jgi:hypothetical protein